MVVASEQSLVRKIRYYAELSLASSCESALSMMLGQQRDARLSA